MIRKYCRGGLDRVFKEVNEELLLQSESSSRSSSEDFEAYLALDPLDDLDSRES